MVLNIERYCGLFATHLAINSIICSVGGVVFNILRGEATQPLEMAKLGAEGIIGTALIDFLSFLSLVSIASCCFNKCSFLGVIITGLAPIASTFLCACSGAAALNLFFHLGLEIGAKEVASPVLGLAFCGIVYASPFIASQLYNQRQRSMANQEVAVQV